MKKPDSLRKWLEEANPYIKETPDCCQLFVSSGSVQSVGVESLSCEYSYILTVTVFDYPKDPDTVLIPILAWLRVNQIELFENAKLMPEAFKFEVDYVTHKTLDMEIKLNLTERVKVTEASGTVTVEHLPEPGLIFEDDIKWDYIFVGVEDGRISS